MEFSGLIYYTCHILIMIEIYILLSSSLNLFSGYMGLFCVNQAVFYGLGAYVCAIATKTYHFSFFTSMLFSVSVSVIIGIVSGLAILRFRGDNFILASYTLQIIAFSIFNNCPAITGGPMGIYDIPRPRVLGFNFDNNLLFFALLSVFFVIVLQFIRRITNSPLKRLLFGIREDELLVIAYGWNTTAFKLKVYIIFCAISAITGCFYASYVSYIDPTSFGIYESIFLLTIVILGGCGSIKGSIIASVVLVAFPEILRLFHYNTTIQSNLNQIVFGLVLICVLMFRPSGMFGLYAKS